ncbi:PCMD domain-containing protein [Parabacteroides sp. AD58]|uniref:PCMD domain-containing protein n=1 Tax=Parabacteroides absconsus TaxID=2951805 RepID=A0ABZ2IIL3_9BACT|nr:PCMD domain-containing protein [Parabacteroides sp. AD58]MCM6901545.1 PCMD domain-containing protein [Parabacteroides sp. AD58]
MNFKYIISSLFLLFLAFGACTEDERGLETQGYLELGVSKNVEVITRGFDVEDQSLAVDICAGANDSIVKHFSDYNDMAGDRVLLDVGTYKVKVSSNPTSKLEFEQPTFYGEKTNVAVTAGKTTAVSVECFLSCVKVTTEFTKPVQDMFASVIARVNDKSGSYLDYGLKETRAGYFQPGYILVDMTLTNKEGLEFKMSKLIDKTEARDHYHLVFDMIESGDDNSGMDFDITIEDDPTNDETHTVTIPLPETGYGQKPPVVKFTGTTDKGVVTVPQSEQTDPKHQVTVTAQSENIGMQKVQLLTQTTSEQFAQIPSVLTLSELTQDSKEYEILSGLGFEFPLDYSDDKAELVYHFTPASLQPGDVKFTLLFQDKNGKMSSGEFTYSVKGELSTESINGDAEYVWSRFAQLRGFAANPQSGGYFKYKKSSETEWQTTGEVTFDSNYASIEIKELTPGTTYDYMFCQGDVEGDVLSFTTEAETEVPNLSLDDWSDQYTPNGWWDSGNSGTSILDYYSTVKEIGSSSNCVKMESSYMNKTLAKKFVSGNIFIGSYKGLSGFEGVHLDFGHEYSSRPAKLKFQYKYTSAKINVINNNRGSATEENDSGFIYFLLTDKIYNIDTTNENSFIKEENYSSDEHILAYGSFTISQSVTAFQLGEINLTYKSLDKKPTHIIIVASSSKKGDYFTGGEGSTLWLDELELVYPSSIDEINK